MLRLGTYAKETNHMTEEDRDKVEAWLEDNGYEAYADYRDEVPVEAVTALLQGDTDTFYAAFDEVERGTFEYADFTYLKDKCISALGLDPDIKDDPEFDEVFMENVWIDMGDYIKTASRNTRLHITATPYTGEPLKPGERLFEEDQDDRLFLFPHGYCSEDENERRRKKLSDVLGVMFPEEAETVYEFDELKMLGTLDIADIIENGPPTHITLGPDVPNELVTHNAVNGSGGCGIVRPTKTVTLPAMFQVDNEDRYGVDSVFGFVGEVWAKPLPASRVE